MRTFIINGSQVYYKLYFAKFFGMRGINYTKWGEILADFTPFLLLTMYSYTCKLYLYVFIFVRFMLLIPDLFPQIYEI